ncbi:uncharacterized protein LOC135810507 [Sycon ciliatum]|uniref:uncharacterized protein LOC135810507 n=1 Tax=Sycon ciliatum TaxID=27933 RepID=UPI0020AAF63E|eukprot:scpid46166/ scgid2475/ 
MAASVTTPLTSAPDGLPGAADDGDEPAASESIFDRLQSARLSALSSFIVTDSSDSEDNGSRRGWRRLIRFEDIKVPFGWPLWTLNLILTVSVTLLHVVESITLPLWIGSYPHRQSSDVFEMEQQIEEVTQKRMAAAEAHQHHRSSSSSGGGGHHAAAKSTPHNVTAVNRQIDRHFSTDPFFVLSFAMTVSTVVYGCSLLSYNMCRTKGSRATKWQFLHREVILNALLTAVPSILVFYSASPRRTAPLLQAVLPLASIPATMVLRYFILRKYPSWAQIVAALLIVAGLIMSLVPNVLTSGSVEEEAVRVKGLAHVLWPIAFMLGHALSAIPNIFTEDSVKRHVKVASLRVNILAFIFWISLYQLMILLLLFWTDFVPQFGTARNPMDFIRRWWLSLCCFVGSNNCSARPGISGTIFLLAFLSENYMTCYLLRYCEGATYVAIAQAFRTPLSALFWTLFNEHPFHWQPHATKATWFSFGALLVMIPALYFYEWAGRKRGKYSGRFAQCLK